MPKQKFEHPVYGKNTVRIFDHEVLRTAREEAGLNTEQVSVAAGIANSTYRGYESGNVAPQADTLAAIAEVLGIDVMDCYPVDEQASGSAHAIWAGPSSPTARRNGRRT